MQRNNENKQTDRRTGRPTCENNLWAGYNRNRSNKLYRNISFFLFWFGNENTYLVFWCLTRPPAVELSVRPSVRLSHVVVVVVVVVVFVVVVVL